MADERLSDVSRMRQEALACEGAARRVLGLGVRGGYHAAARRRGTANPCKEEPPADQEATSPDDEAPASKQLIA